jgi:hypothetical protein
MNFTSIPLLFSAVGVIISVITLYLTKLRKPKIDVILEHKFLAAYNYDGTVDFFDMHLPFAIVNTGAAAGVIFRCAANLSSKANPDENYFMNWRWFLRVDERYVYDEVVHPFILMGNSSLHKIIYFSWYDQNKKIKLEPGEYELRFYLWLNPKINVKPDKINIHRFNVDETQISELEESLAAAKIGETNPYVEFALDGTKEGNQLLTEAERKELYDR